MFAVEQSIYTSPLHLHRPLDLYADTIRYDLIPLEPYQIEEIFNASAAINDESFFSGLPNEEKETVTKAQMGCPISMKKLCNENYRRIEQFVKKKVSSREDAQDIVQETFLQVALYINKFNGNSRFSTWITGIAFNVVRNYYNRTPQFKYVFVDTENVLDNVECADQPESSYAWLQMAKELGLAFGSMDKQHKEVLTLLVEDGMSYKEISKKLGLSIPAVKSRIFRARRLMKTDRIDQIMDDYMP